MSQKYPPEPCAWQCPSCLVVYAPYVMACGCLAKRAAEHPPLNLVELLRDPPVFKDEDGEPSSSA